MEIIIQPTPEAGGIIAARIIAKLVRTKPECVLGLATGTVGGDETPIRRSTRRRVRLCRGSGAIGDGRFFDRVRSITSSGQATA